MNIIFPALLEMLENGDKQALLGIKEVVAQKSGELLPYLIPKLINLFHWAIFKRLQLRR